MIHYHRCALHRWRQEPRKDLAMGTGDTVDAGDSADDRTEFAVAREAARVELAESEARLAVALEALDDDEDLSESGLDIDRLRGQD